MLKALLSCLIILGSIVLLSNSVYAETQQEYIDRHQDNLIILCEDGYGEMADYLVYQCIMTEFYGLHNVVNIILTMKRAGEDWDFLIGLFTEYKWPAYDTYDFMAIHLYFEEYLEEKKACE